MRKKRLFALCIACLLGCQTLSAAAEDQIDWEEESLVQILDESDVLEYFFIGKSFWENEEEFGGSREDASELILEFLENQGIDMEEITSEDLIEAIDYAYEYGYSSDILSISLDMMGEDSQSYRDTVLEEFHRQAIDSQDEDYLLLETGRFPEAALMYKNDWYGDRTDDERIELADAILEVLESVDVETDGYNGNTLAQALNDLYDQDAGDSVLYLAFDILEEQDLYISLVENILFCLEESY